MDCARILVIDDDADVLTAARLLLRQHFESVLIEPDPTRIAAHMAAAPIDVFLLDMNFAIGSNTGAEGMTWMRRILETDPAAVVVLMTAFGDLNTAVTAIKEGAADFVLKPWQNEKLIATLGVAAELSRSKSVVDRLKGTLTPPEADFIADSPAMQAVMRLVERAAPTDANVLILGENGTGKELIAQAIHKRSSRANEVLLSIDLGAIPESLFEAELFGHVKGAFTDAHRDRAGRFQAADGGTLFLDEIGNLQLPSQTKLLRVLESREVTAVGSDRSVAVDVRLISATNRVLDEGFRDDLKYRINTIQIDLPPLRERLEDLPALVEHFVRIYSRKYRIDAKRLDDGALAALARHHWPGNVRELGHAIERALILADGDVLTTADFALGAPADAPLPPGPSLNLEASERRLIDAAMRRYDGNISRAASALGITRAALYRRLEKFDLS